MYGLWDQIFSKNASPPWGVTLCICVTVFPEDILLEFAFYSGINIDRRPFFRTFLGFEDPPTALIMVT